MRSVKTRTTRFVPAAVLRDLMVRLLTAAGCAPDAAATAAEVFLTADLRGLGEIRIPGERAFAEEARRRQEGVPVYDVVWARTAKLAAELGVAMPA